MAPLSKIALALLFAAPLAGCVTSDLIDPQGYLDRRETISLHAGDAVATNKVTQMYDPWPPYSADYNFSYNGQRAQAAAERYRQNRVIPPRGISASGVYAPVSNDNPVPAPAPTPVGPTVNQVK
jgi:hypothetical protein